MRSSPTITIFSSQPEPIRKPYSFLISILAHVTAIGLLLLGIMSAPRIQTTVLAERYTVRHLELQSLDPEMEQAAANAVDDYRHNMDQAATNGSQEAQQLMQQVPDALPAHQTLIQPDLPKPLTVPVDTPLPSVVVWNAANTPAKTIVAPMPQKPPVANVKPSIQKPRDEVLLANVSIPSANLPSVNQPLLPSTTTPVVLQGPKPTTPAPVTTAAGSARPTSATVMSLSSLHMAKGSVILPPVNQTASSKQPRQGQGNKNGTGAGQHSGASGTSASGAGQGSNIGFGQGGQFSTVHITRQKEGQFGAVVVGSSLVEKYPETAEMWNGRMSYTVYLHLGLPKSWILQYSLPRSNGAAKDAHVEAPWPYSIVRPNIAPGAIDADALMVHGFVNQAGRFESLAVAFPPGFSQTQFVLSSLAQWQFRPATQNGQNVRVEVLLIIPEILE